MSKTGVRLHKPQDVRRLLQRVINELLEDEEMTNEKARVISTLTNSLMKSMELGEMDERLSELEKRIKENEKQN